MLQIAEELGEVGRLLYTKHKYRCVLPGTTPNPFPITIENVLYIKARIFTEAKKYLQMQKEQSKFYKHLRRFNIIEEINEQN